MTATPILSTPSRGETVAAEERAWAHCEDEFQAAKKEMGAFVLAAATLFGSATSAIAAECWVELAESMELKETPDGYDWRMISIRAASLMESSGLWEKKGCV